MPDHVFVIVFEYSNIISQLVTELIIISHEKKKTETENMYLWKELPLNYHIEYIEYRIFGVMHANQFNGVFVFRLILYSIAKYWVWCDKMVTLISFTFMFSCLVRSPIRAIQKYIYSTLLYRNRKSIFFWFSQFEMWLNFKFRRYNQNQHIIWTFLFSAWISC